MKGISRDDALQGLVALDLLGQKGEGDVGGAEVRTVQKIAQPDALHEVEGLVDSWRTSPGGPVAEARRFLEGLARRLGVDVAHGLDAIGKRFEDLLVTKARIDGDPGVWAEAPPKKWRLLDRISEQLRSLRGAKAQLGGAFSNAIAAAAQHLKDEAVLEALEKKVALGGELTAEERRAVLEMRDRRRVDFDMAIQDPDKARRYAHNGVGEQRALEAIADYARIQAILGEPVSEGGLQELRTRVYVSVLGALVRRAEKTIAEGSTGWAESVVCEVDHALPRSLIQRKDHSVLIPADLLAKLAVLQTEGSKERTELDRLREEGHVRFWAERGKEPPSGGRRTPDELTNEQVFTARYSLRPWEIVEQVEKRGGLEKMGATEADQKKALAAEIAFYLDLQVFSENSLLLLFDQWNPFLLPQVEERLARVDRCMALMNQYGITNHDLESSDVMLHYRVEEMLAEIARIRGEVPMLAFAAKQEAA
jgi:hypothetical protein